MRRFIFIPGLLAILLLGATSHGQSPEEDLVSDATAALRNVIEVPVTAIPPSIMNRVTAIAIVPSASGEGTVYEGVGVISVRQTDRDGWTLPMLVSFSGTIPVGLNTDAIDVILVAITSTGRDYLLRKQFTVTDQASIPPGPIGQDTEIGIQTDILAYVRFDEFFAGIALRNVCLEQQSASDDRLYGGHNSTDDVLSGLIKHGPAAAREWRRTLAAYFRKMT